MSMQKAVVVLSAAGLIVLLLNMFGNRPSFVSYRRLPSAESELTFPTSSQGLFEENKEAEWDVHIKRRLDERLWGIPGPVLEACWSTRLPKFGGKPSGFVVITASNGPHNHRAQIADSVVVASHLGATLVLPSVKEALKEPNSRFEDIYIVKNFISSLEDIVRVVGRLPKEMEKVNRTVTSIPLQVSREYIDEKIRPVLKQQGVVFLGSFLPAKKGEKADPEVTAIRCLVMHKALQYVPLIQKLGDRLLNRLREAAPESSGKRFVAVDLQVDLLRHQTCNNTSGVNKKRCLEPHEIGQFLKSLGYPSETAIYLTQTRWEPSLEALQEIFPNVHTKEYTMPFNEENQYLFSGKTQFEKAVDFYVCARSDVFVPTVPGVFYAHVSGERITQGLNHIIVPAVKRKLGSSAAQITGVISPYVEKKSHPVYLCYHQPSPDLNVTQRVGVVDPPALELIQTSVVGKNSQKELAL